LGFATKSRAPSALSPTRFPNHRDAKFFVDVMMRECV
jgi:hypothetical protein